jgi:F-type H+-transporting ATPase subunit delta
MKVPKEARKLSRSLFRASLTGERLDPARVAIVLKTMAQRPPRHAFNVLKNYERLIRLELDRRHATIESATALSEPAAAQILADLQHRFGADITHEVKVQPALIGGLRVQLGGNIWDGSIQGRLAYLQSSFERP